MTFFKRFLHDSLLSVQKVVEFQMMCVILKYMSKQKIRLYTTRNRGLSVRRPRILPTWYSDKKAILNAKQGEEIVYVDFPMNLVLTGEVPFYSSHLGCYLYKLKGSGLRFAKRSCKKFRTA